MTRKSPLRRLRQASQVVTLGLFLWLFLQTEYRGEDQLSYPVSLLFRIDPLAALADALAPGGFGWKLLWPALLLVAATFLLGRFFCGWICPLGTTLDGCAKVLGRGKRRMHPAWRHVKYYLLLALSGAALFGVQLMGLFDPLSIFLRTLTLSLYPVYNLLANGFFDFFYHREIPLLSPLVNDSYAFFHSHFMAFHQPVFALALFTFAVFLVLVLLEKVEGRFWCKNLCPLGALLGLCSRFSLLRRDPLGSCPGCRDCVETCRMGAAERGEHHAADCIRCLDCTSVCPKDRVGFSWGRESRKGGTDLTRRGLVASVACGALISPLVAVTPGVHRQNSYFLRPPGAAEEREFLARCIRCGECMKVCIAGGLQPAFLQAGATGLWSPMLVPRIGFCEFNCTLCGQVCPTGALKNLTKPEKHKAVIGLAVIDRNRCLPYDRGEECLVCEEHCPTGEKAIILEEREVRVKGSVQKVKFPTVVKSRCVGCGICETRCPVEGAGAIRVVNEGESRRVAQNPPVR